MKKTLFEYVHEVLSQNELIIVPNFGAFVLQKTTTFLNDGEYISIIFSAQQQNNDGVLSQYIATNNNTTEEDAEEFIETALEDIFNAINDTGLYKVDGIGEFRAINERIIFKPLAEQYLLKLSEEPVIKEEIKPTIIPETIEKIVEPIVEPIADIQPSTEKIDIDAIKQTYAQRNVANNEPEPQQTKVEPAQKAFDFSKIKIPIIVITIIAILGILAYAFRNEIATLNKPIVTNDTTQVVTEQNLNQLSDTLTDIQNTQESEITTPESTPTNIEVNNPNNSTDIERTNTTRSVKVMYGNNTTTMYYVTKAAFVNKQEAIAEKQNLDYTGFEALVIETDGSKKYHVVIAEFNDITLAKQELSFFQKIDNSFYLMTVKPRK